MKPSDRDGAIPIGDEQETKTGRWPKEGAPFDEPIDAPTWEGTAVTTYAKGVPTTTPTAMEAKLRLEAAAPDMAAALQETVAVAEAAIRELPRGYNAPAATALALLVGNGGPARAALKKAGVTP